MTAEEILKNVLAAMQAAEEVGGPEGTEYLALMDRIKNEAITRRETYLDIMAVQALQNKG